MPDLVFAGVCAGAPYPKRYAHRGTFMRVIATVLLSLVLSVSYAQNFGSFEGDVVAKWIDGRKMKLVEPFAYIDPSGLRWEAPKGSTVDGASIPQFAWSIIGGPFEGKYRQSSVIHDVACDKKERSWRSVHETFYYGMLASGVSPAKAKIMYAAVYHFGPRWSLKKPIIVKGVILEKTLPPQKLTQEDFHRLRQAIEKQETDATPMSLRQIEEYK
jgi:hypothetical protein